MLLQISTSEGSLDLMEGSDRDFYITKQLRDVHSLDTREGDFTKTLRLPYTPNNLRLIGLQTPLLTRHKDEGTQFIPVEVKMRGFVVIDSPIMRVESGDTDFFTVTIFGGVVGFFVQLSDEPIRRLDWSDPNFTFEWTQAELQTRKNINAGEENILFPNCSWYTNKSIDLFRSKNGVDIEAGINDLQLQYSGFFMYVDTVMRKITNGLTGLIVDYGDLDKEDRYNRLAFANKMPFLRAAYGVPIGGNFFGRSSDGLNPVNGQLDFKSLQVETVPTPTGGLVLINNEWVIPRRGFHQMRLSITWPTTPINPDCTVSIMRNDTLVRSYLINSRQGEERVDIFDMQTEANDRVWVRVQTRGTAGVQMFSTLRNIMQLSRDAVGSPLDMDQFLPDISQRDFVRAVFNMFNIIAVQSQGQVTFKLWDNIPIAEPLELDVDLVIPPKESGVWGGYAARNFVSYFPNELVTRQDQNAFFDIRVASTEKELDKIQLPFSALDDTITTEGNGQIVRAGVPSITINFEQLETQITYGAGSNFTTLENHGLSVGDIIVVEGNYSQITLVRDGKDAQSQIRLVTSNAPNFGRIKFTEADSAPLHLALMNQATGTFRIMAGSTVSETVGDFKNAVFDSSLGWPALLNDYFKNLVNAVSNPFKLEAWFDISILTYIEIDQTRPVYIASYGALFYINIVEQFKAVGKVRMELLQVGAATNLVADAQGLQVGAFSNDFSNDFDNYDINEI